MQLWVVHHLISQTPFDIWDLMLCEMEDTLAEGFKGHRQLPYAHWISSDLLVSCLQRFELRYQIPLLLFQSMTFVSCGLLLPESRHLGQDSVRGQRFQRQQLSKTRPFRVLLRPSLQILMLSLLIQLRMMPPTAQTRTTSLSLSTALLGLTTMKPVVQAQPPAQTQPWWLFLRG
jgi:hypothetical protein